MSSRQDVQRDRVEELLSPPLRARGLDVEAVEITPAGKRRVLRVAIDTDGGVTLDDVADATREISAVLDDSDVMGEMPFTLEVTSRGVDRPLSLPRHWRRNADRLVAVTLHSGDTLTGRVTTTSETAAVLDVDGVEHEVAFADVAKALVQVEFNRRSGHTRDVEGADDLDDTDDPGDPDDVVDDDDDGPTDADPDDTDLEEA